MTFSGDVWGTIAEGSHASLPLNSPALVRFLRAVRSSVRLASADGRHWVLDRAGASATTDGVARGVRVFVPHTTPRCRVVFDHWWNQEPNTLNGRVVTLPSTIAALREFCDEQAVHGGGNFFALALRVMSRR